MAARLFRDDVRGQRETTDTDGPSVDTGVQEGEMNEIKVCRVEGRRRALLWTGVTGLCVVVLAVLFAGLPNYLQWFRQRSYPQGPKLAGRSLQSRNLANLNLRGSNFEGADLSGARLSGADLRFANLWDANLTGVNLDYALYDDTTRWPSGFDPKRSGARPLMPGTSLIGADLSLHTLRGARLRNANLQKANLLNCDLADVDLRGADLSFAKLNGADLRTAELAGVKLAGARYDASTQWPAGFSPAQHGAHMGGRAIVSPIRRR
jgi:uncharacterized protein YjbI with pentapeptide repeats